MNWKKLILAWIAGSVLLYVTMFAFSALAMQIAPFDIFSISGMRPANDPVMLLYFAYPLVLSFTAAYAFSVVRSSLPGSFVEKGLMFGFLLILLLLVNNIFVIFSSMVYPAGFFIEMVLNGVISYPLLGIIYAKIWDMQLL
jgi:hypothetical protein